MFMLRLLLVLTTVLTTALTTALTTLSAATLPTSFAEVQIASGLNPTKMAFAPDGRLFLCEKQGLLRIVKNGSLLSTPMLDITGQVDSWNERGLGTVCLDPSFTSNGYIYLYYTAKSPVPHNRVSRFTVSGDVVVGGSELVLLDITNLSSVGWHNGGGMRFGQDGKLYISTGENANQGYASNKTNLLGKLLRINSDGSIPSDNPYGLAGSLNAIVALGLRNPFALAVQPGTGILYINNVGAGSYEEINRYDTGAVPVRADYGWGAGIEGYFNQSGGQSAPVNYRDPVHAYDHGVGYCIVSGDFYNPSAPGAEAFPSAYQGRYFFCDYSGWIKYIDPANPGTRNNFASGIARPIEVQVAPDGALWYIARAGQGGGSDADNSSTTNGTLWRVRYTGTVQTATKLAFIQQPSNTNGGTTITPAVTVAVQDASGATVTGSSAAVTLALGANPGGSSLNGTKTRSAVNGIATFNDLSITSPGNGYSLIAAASGLTGATSNTFTILSQVTAPNILPNGGSFTGPVTVQLSTATAGATIRYTIDGSTPSSSSTLYSAPFTRNAGTTVRAIALKSGSTTSAVSSATFAISGSTTYGLPYREQVSGLNIPAAGATSGSLSLTNVFANLATLDARPGIVPYSVNSPLWSDNAQKRRWVAMPGAAKIAFAPTGEWSWPGGTIFVKHFELNTDERSPATMRRLETRVLVVNGASTYGLTYKWRADNSDADLVADTGLNETITITTASSATRSQTWDYPSRTQCMQCHTPTNGYVLGPKTRQLNGDYAYPAAGGGNQTIDNQLRTWNYLGMFTTNIGEGNIAGYTKLVTVTDTSASLEKRSRSYLDANCASCHLPGGTPSAWDARFDTPLASAGIINGTVRDSLGIGGAKIVAPHDVPRSLLHHRMNSTSPTVQMPPLARNVVHTAAIDTIAQWINSFPVGLPSPWVSADIGTPGLTGSADYANSIFSLNGSGADIWGTSDQFQFVYQPLAADGTIIARLDALQNTDGWAKAGVMMRGSLAANAPFAMCVISASNGAAFQWRDSAGASAQHVGQSGIAAPHWVRLVRSGALVTASIAADAGGSPGTWSALGTGQTMPSGTLQVGMVVTAHNNGVLSNASFSQVSVTTASQSFAANINFQPSSVPTESGYLVDGGEVYAARNGQSYGWNAAVPDATRDRNALTDQLRDTLVHLQKPAVPDAVWEIAVPNGTYQVYAVSGDPSYYDGIFHLIAEGTTVLQGTPTSASRFVEGTAQVMVTDGRLTIRSGTTASNNKLCFLEITQIPTGNQ